MSLLSVLLQKELAQNAKPLLLALFSFDNGSQHGYATDKISFGGINYDGILLDQGLTVSQALSQGGIDVIPECTIKLADSAKDVWQNVEMTGPGFKGAILTLTFIFQDFNSGSITPDSWPVGNFVCDPASADETSISIHAVSSLNLQRSNLPSIRIQRTDPYPFPTTLADRTAALNDPTSPFYAIGYSYGVPDTGNGPGFGNPMPGTTTPYTAATWDGTLATYKLALGNGNDLLHDTSGRIDGNMARNPVCRADHICRYRIYKFQQNPGNQRRHSEFVPDVHPDYLRGGRNRRGGLRKLFRRSE